MAVPHTCAQQPKVASQSIMCPGVCSSACVVSGHDASQEPECCASTPCVLNCSATSCCSCVAKHWSRPSLWVCAGRYSSVGIVPWAQVTLSRPHAVADERGEVAKDGRERAHRRQGLCAKVLASGLRALACPLDVAHSAGRPGSVHWRAVKARACYERLGIACLCTFNCYAGSFVLQSTPTPLHSSSILEQLGKGSSFCGVPAERPEYASAGNFGSGWHVQQSLGLLCCREARAGAAWKGCGGCRSGARAWSRPPADTQTS